MRRRTIIATAATAAILVGGGAAGAAVALSGGGDDGEGTATGPQAEAAKAAALTHVKNGTVTGVERDGENGATWEVEIRRPDGTSVDVRLNADMQLVVAETDHETGDSTGDR